MQYLWQYYLLIGLVCIQGACLFSKSKSSRTIFLCLCFVELTFIAGFREWHIGNDTPNYINAFIRVGGAYHLDMITSHMEKGYLLYNQLLALFSSFPQTILISNALLITGILFHFFHKYSVSVFMSVLLFVILQFGGTLNIMRQYLSLAIVLLGMPFIIRRKFWAFFLCCVLAMTFHRSALLALGLYFLYPLHFKFQHLIAIGLVTLFAFIFLAPLVDQIILVTGHYAGYKGNILLGEFTKLASIIDVFIQFSITVFCCLSYKYCYRSNAINTSPLRVDFLLLCSVVATCLQIVSIRGIVLGRLTLYFSIFNLLSIPFFIRCYSKKSRLLVTISIVGCFILYRSIILVYRPEWNHLLPFEFCF